MEKVILIIILQCSLAGLKYYFQLFYKAYKKSKKKTSTANLTKQHHL